MKKQINPKIKAHLIRSAFYVLLLVAVCVIPFALAQRNTTKHSVASKATAKAVAGAPRVALASTGAATVRSAQEQAVANINKQRISQVPLRSAPLAIRRLVSPPAPKAPQGVLYDQYDNGSGVATIACSFTDFPTDSADLADDFVVPAGQTWNVMSIDADGVYFNGPGPANNWNVFIYTDSGGLPGTQVYSILATTVAQVGTTFTVTLTPAAVLSEGTYWIEIQANMTFGTGGEWGWTDRTVLSNSPAAWQNPGGGFGVCPTWAPKLAVCIPTAGGPDQVYRINGTTGTSSCTNYDFTLGTATFVAGVDNIGQSCDDCLTPVTLPFPVNLYDQTFTTAMVGSNGSLQFGTTNATFAITCSPFGVAGTTYTMGPYWVDQVDFNAGEGVFTTTTGTAPNRIFYIEYLTTYFGDQTVPLDYEIALYENGSPPFQYIYNVIGAATGNDSELTIGVKKDDTTFTQYACDTGGGTNPPVSSGQAVTASCAAGASPTPTPTASPTCTPGGQAWSEVGVYPFAARGPFVVSDGTFYYTGGGYDGTNVHADVFKYDPTANTYTPLASAPDPFFLSQAVYDSTNNKIYSIAGFNLGGQSTTTRIYDVAGNSWTTGTAIPEPNGLSDAATGLDSTNGNVLVACGFNGSGASNTLHIYNIAGDSWTLGASAPTAVYLPGFGTINGKFYVASGNNGATEVADLQIYDIASGTWSEGPPVPTPVTAPGSAVIGGKLYVFSGGAPFPTTTTITQIYDPGTNSWSSGPNMVTGKVWFYGGGLDDTSIFAPGGDNPVGIPTNDAQLLAGGGCGSPTPTPTPTPTGSPICSPQPWVTAANMAVDLYGPAGASDGTFFYTAGGYSFSSGNTLAVFNKYDPGTNSWTSLPDMPQSAIMATAVYWPTGNKIFVFGGEDAVSATNYNINRIYDIASNTWSTGANLPGVISFSHGGYSPATGKIYLLSGYNTGTVDSAQPNTWEYDPSTDTWTDLTGTVPFPHPVGGAAYGVVNGKVYVAGGRDATNTIINTTWQFDPTVPAYTQMTDEPASFQNNVPGSAGASGVLWVYGGGNPFVGGSASKATSHSGKAPFDLKKAAFPWAWVKSATGPAQPTTGSDGRFFDPVGNTWTNSPNLNTAVSFAAGGAIGEAMIVCAGGYDGASSTTATETEVVCGAAQVSPTPTATATFTPTPTATATFTPTPTATATSTATPTATPTATATETPRPTPTPRPRPTPFPRPTP